MAAQHVSSSLDRFIKLDALGKELPADSIAAVAVKDIRTNLIWSLEESTRFTWARAKAYAASLATAGHSDWRLPTREELLTLVDDTRHSPAIDVAYFPGCKSDWYWTSTPTAYSPGVYAWNVSFGYGSAIWGDQDYECFVRAVRASQL